MVETYTARGLTVMESEAFIEALKTALKFESKMTGTGSKSNKINTSQNQHQNGGN